MIMLPALECYSLSILTCPTVPSQKKEKKTGSWHFLQLLNVHYHTRRDDIPQAMPDATILANVDLSRDGFPPSFKVHYPNVRVPFLPIFTKISGRSGMLLGKQEIYFHCTPNRYFGPVKR